MIIVEGPDNSGKTTLTKRLALDLGLTILDRPHGPVKEVKDLWDRTQDIGSKVLDKNIIVDRHPYFGECIYGPILRGQNIWDQAKDLKAAVEFILESARKRHQLLIIYCRPPRNVVLDFSTHEVKEYDTHEHLEGLKNKGSRILDTYDSFMQTWGDISYDYTKPNSYKDLLNYIKEYYNER